MMPTSRVFLVAGPCLWDPSPTIEGAPARNQNAITASNIMQPNDDVGMKGQIGLPQRWWTMSQQERPTTATTNEWEGRKPEAAGRRQDGGKKTPPGTDPATQIHTARASHEDRVHSVAAWLLHQRHDDDEHDGSDDWADVVHGE